MSEQARSLRELARDGTLNLADFWVAFWLGLFERQGKTKLLIRPLSYGTPVPATRELVIISLNALGAAEIFPGNVGGNRLYELLSERPYDFLHPNFRHEFEGMQIPESDLKKWLEGPDRPIGTRIKRVLRAAERIADADPRLSFNEIAVELAKRTGRFAGYAPDSIRKILSGRYPAQRRFGIPGLKVSR